MPLRELRTNVLLLIFLFIAPCQIFAQSGTKLVASNGAAQDLFGNSVSVDGNFVAVGALWSDQNGNNSGAAYIFIPSGQNWSERSILDPPDNIFGDEFGVSVSVMDMGVVEYAVVGAHKHNEDVFDSGTVHTFAEGDFRDTLNISDRGEGDQFGGAVSLSLPFALIGAVADSEQGERAGASYIFRREGVQWRMDGDKLLASDGEPEDEFGKSVDLDNSIAIIGAPLKNDNTGAAYIFQKEEANWEEVTRLVNNEADTGDLFGYSVSISGNYAIVGAPGKDAVRDGAPSEDSLKIDSGAAYIFRNNDGAWVQSNKLEVSGGNEMDKFGWSVSISGDFAIVGAPREIAFNDGAAYLYQRIDSSWHLIRELRSGRSAGDLFGYSVSIDTEGERFVVGAPRDDSLGIDSGAAYVYSLNTAPNFVSANITEGKVGDDYRYQVQATGFPLPEFSFAENPNGMEIDDSGVITWKPTRAGMFDVVVLASNDVGESAEAEFTISVTDASFPVELNQPFGDISETSSYRLISLPGLAQDDAGDDAGIDIGATLPGTHNEDWVAYRDDGTATGFYKEYESSNPLFQFRPGRGFLVLSKNRWVVNQRMFEVPLDDAGTYTINTVIGWNIISSPFFEPIRWDAVLAINSDLASTDSIFGYEGAFEPVDSFEVYKAYYFHSSTGNGLKLPHPSFQVISSDLERQQEVRSVTIRAMGNDGMHKTAHIVLDENASSLVDDLDQRSPRNNFESLQIGFELEQSEDLFYIDARPLTDSITTFDLTLKAVPDSEISLDVSGLSTLDKRNLYLVDRINGETVDLRKNSQILLKPVAPITHYQVVISSQLPQGELNLIDQETGNIAMLPNYPNPFTHSTNISFSIPHQERIKIEVWDILGRKVQLLEDGLYSEGTYSIEWDGRNSSGDFIPSGVYIIRLETTSGKSDNQLMIKRD